MHKGIVGFLSVGLCFCAGCSPRVAKPSAEPVSWYQQPSVATQWVAEQPAFPIQSGRVIASEQTPSLTPPHMSH